MANRAISANRANRAISAVLVGSLLVLPACGAKTDEAARAAGVTPANALALITVNLDPSIEQKRRLLGIARKFPAASDTVKATFDQTRDALLGDLVKEAGLDFGRDVEPWLGSEVAFTLLPAPGGSEPLAAVLLHTTDESKARAALEKSRRNGDFEGRYRVVDDFVVVSDQGTTEADDEKALDVVAAQAEKDDGGLARAKGFTEVVDELAGDRLVLGWADVPALLRLGGESGAIPGFDFTRVFKDASSVAVDIHAGDEALVLEGVSRPFSEGEGGTPRLTEGLPADSLGALTFFDVADVFEQVLGILGGGAGGGGGDFSREFEEQTGLDLQGDILSWMEGEFVLVAGAVPEGRSFPDFAMVVEPTDMEKATAAVPRIVAAVEDGGGIELEERKIAGTTAYVVPEPFTAGVQPSMALFDGRFVLANRPEYLEQLSKDAATTLGESAPYRTVVGEGSSKTVAQLVLRLDPIREAVENAFLGEAGSRERERYDREVRPNLEPLDAFGLIARHVGKFDRFEMKVTFD